LFIVSLTVGGHKVEALLNAINQYLYEMKKVLFMLLAVLLCASQLFSQVRVRGYYRKNGTYVAPHYRSNPDGNPYNNWSYPGNTNPYTGKVASGNPSTYLDNYYNRGGSTTSAGYQYSSPYNSGRSSSGIRVLYKTHFTDLPFSPPLRSGPGLEYDEIYKCTLGSEVYVLEQGGIFYKVVIDGHIGYISGQLLRYRGNMPAKSYSTTSESGILYQTYIIEGLVFNVPLREGPGTAYREVYECSSGTIVYVISREGLFYKVKVNGYVGYISKNFLR